MIWPLLIDMTLVNPCEDTLSEFADSLFLPSELADSVFLSFSKFTQRIHWVNPRTELLLPSSHGLSTLTGELSNNFFLDDWSPDYWQPINEHIIEKIASDPEEQKKFAELRKAAGYAVEDRAERARQELEARKLKPAGRNKE